MSKRDDIKVAALGGDGSAPPLSRSAFQSLKFDGSELLRPSGCFSHAIGPRSQIEFFQKRAAFLIAVDAGLTLFE
jgi:hypothetical protein